VRKGILDIILFISVLATLNSCKKEKNDITDLSNVRVGYCNTVPDCKAVGKYLVTASFYYIDPWGGGAYDTVYGQTIITITEISPGTIQLTDDTLIHKQFSAVYDSMSSTSNTFIFNSISYPTSQIEIFGGDSIAASFAFNLYASTTGFDSWIGTRVH
jgi:hypothetical protein